MLSEQLKTLLDSFGELSAKQPEAIKLLHSVYKELFGETVKKECGDCITKAFLRVQKEVYLQSQKQSNFNLEKMKTISNKAFVLAKGKTLDIGMTGVILTNDNMDDLKAAKTLNQFPNLIKYFVAYPKDEDGNLDLSGYDLEATKVIVSPVEETSKILSETPVSKTSAKTPVEKVVETPAAPASLKVVKPEVKAQESKADSPPHKAGERLPNEGETIAAAAIRFDVSERTIERDMKAAKIDIKAWKEKTAVVVETPAAPATENKDAEGVKTSEGVEGQENKDNSAEQENEPKMVDFVVTEQWLIDNADAAKEHDIKLGDVIEVEVEDESSEEEVK